MSGLHRSYSAVSVGLIIFTIALGFLVCSTSNAPAATNTKEEPGAQGKYSKLALLLGINDYKYKGDYLKPLHGAVERVNADPSLQGSQVCFDFNQFMHRELFLHS